MVNVREFQGRVVRLTDRGKLGVSVVERAEVVTLYTAAIGHFDQLGEPSPVFGVAGKAGHLTVGGEDAIKIARAVEVMGGEGIDPQFVSEFFMTSFACQVGYRSELSVAGFTIGLECGVIGRKWTVGNELGSTAVEIIGG